MRPTDNTPHSNKRSNKNNEAKQEEGNVYMFTKPKGTHYIELTCTARHRRVPLQVLQLLLDPLGSHRSKSEPKSIIHIKIHDQTTETMKQNTRHLPQRIKLFRAKQREISDLRQIDHVKTKPPSKIKIDHQPLEPRKRWPPNRPETHQKWEQINRSGVDDIIV